MKKEEVFKTYYLEMRHKKANKQDIDEFEENKDALTKYLYCIEKLGVTDLKENFKGNYIALFKELEKEKEKEMKDSPLYQSFKK